MRVGSHGVTAPERLARLLPMTDDDTGTRAEEQETAGAVVRRLGPAAWLAGLWMLLPAIGGFTLLANMKPASDWLNSHYELGPPVYVAIFVITAGFGFLPTYAQAVLGGFAFAWWGVPAALVGFVGAACVGRIVAATVSGDRVEREIERNAKAMAVREALVGRGFWPTLGIVTLVRVPPNSPFALTNLALTTAGVGWVPYVVGTAAGMLPRTAAAVYIGMQVQDWSSGVPKPKWLLIGGIVVAIAAVIVIGSIANKAIHRVTGVGQASGADAPETDAKGNQG